MIIGIIIIVLLILLDQVSKHLAVYFLVEGASKVIISKLLTFQLVYNPGASFGILKGESLLFVVITVVALLIFGYMFTETNFKQKGKKVFSIAIALLIAGALGNAIDRIFIAKGVIDFIHIPLVPIFATFNFADAYMNIGIVLLFIDILFLEKRREPKNEEI